LEALAGLAEATRATRMGGAVILHSWLPPLLWSGDMVGLGVVERTTWVDTNGALKPLYVLRVSHAPPG
jgi:hypothetical protein